MTFVLRDRPDGQVEIIVERPVLVGIFPERDTAEKVRAFLQADAEEPDEEPPLFSHDGPSVDVASDEPVDLVAEIEAAGVDQNVVSVTQDPKARRVRQTTANLPAVVPDQPTPTALIVHTPPRNPDRGSDIHGLRAPRGRREAGHRRGRPRDLVSPASWHVGAEPPHGAKAPGGRRSGALPDVQDALHPVALQSRDLRPVQP